MPVVVIDVPSLGNRCHLVHDGTVALVVDPPRDLAPVELAAEAAGVEIAAVADTHVHNDYVSGAPALARRHHADHLLAADEVVQFERTGVRGGDVVPVGRLDVEVLATPGHTRHHQSFLVRAPGEDPALLSGGSLLHGTVGRTDLVDPGLAERLAAAQWDSARLQGALDPRTLLLPTHGFGSFCAGTATDGPSDGPTDRPVTVGDQHTRNPALLTPREAFVTDLVAGFGPIPGHYAHMDPLNRAGAGAVAPRPARRVTAEQVTDAVLSGAWVIDLRARADHADAHLAGSVGVEYSGQFATYVGWLVPWDEDLVLLTDTPDVLDDAVTDLARIGIEGVGTHVLAADEPLEAGFRRAGWTDLRAALRRGDRVVVVDVRQREEWEDAHLRGAVHVPVQDVEHRAPTLPPGELWVHCRSGYRAGIAASLLHRTGRDVVHVDDSWDELTGLDGLELVPAAA